MRMKRGGSRVVALVVISTLWCSSPAYADQIRVLISGGFSAAYLEVLPEFQRTTRHVVFTANGASIGTAPDSIPNRLGRGEPADVLIMASTAMDELIKEGRVVAGSKIDLARSRIGMAVRAGAPRPDISTVEALRQTLLQAKSVAYSTSASGVYLSMELFPRLGIADQIASKSVKVESGPVGAVVARGGAEIGFQQISELLPVRGIDYVGPLPGEAQRITIFSAGLTSRAEQSRAAKALIAFLASSAVVRAIVKSGLEPIR